MHVVEPGMKGWFQSKCRLSKRNGHVPRAWAPEEDWTEDRLWYPDCQQCRDNEAKPGDAL